MKTTIDKAGRVVIPAEIRAKAGLLPGTEIEVVLDDFSVRLSRKAQAPKLVRAGKLLVAEPAAKASERAAIDVAELIGEERDRWPG